MYAVIGIIFLVGSVPALWFGAKMVVVFDLPFVAFSLPMFACLSIAAWAITKAEQEMAR